MQLSAILEWESGWNKVLKHVAPLSEVKLTEINSEV